MSYKKVGGIHFVKLGRFGFNFYISRSNAQKARSAIHAVERALRPDAPIGVRSRVVNGQRVFH